MISLIGLKEAISLTGSLFEHLKLVLNFVSLALFL